MSAQRIQEARGKGLLKLSDYVKAVLTSRLEDEDYVVAHPEYTSLHALAKASGISCSSLHWWLRDERLISELNFNALCHFLGLFQEIE